MTDLHRIQTYARSILEGEGQDEHSPALVEAVRVAMTTCEIGGGYSLRDCMVMLSAVARVPWDEAAWRRQTETMTRAALSTIRKHQAGE